MPKLLFIENQDSFSGIIADYLTTLGMDVVWVDHRQDPSQYRADQYAGMVLSPGPGRPETSGNLMAFTNRFYAHLPILGICLGHQALAIHAGGRVAAANDVVHGKVSQVSLKPGHTMWQGLGETVAAVRYHSLAVLECGAGFEPVAWTRDGQIMAMAHAVKPIWGIQWHPEALLSESGLRLLQNWLTFANIPNQPLALGRSPNKPTMKAGPLLPI
jgi:anthranilate synthase/aminodeoxychorismate synthase-like glutamine amidotransferase